MEGTLNKKTNGYEDLDNYLLDRFQQLSDWLQGVSGKNCFWFALAILLIQQGIEIASWLKYGWKLTEVLISLMSLGVFLYGIGFITSHRMVGRANPLRYAKLAHWGRFISLGSLVGCIWGITQSLITGNIDRPEMYSWASGTLYVPIYYFLSCSPGSNDGNASKNWLEMIFSTSKA